MYKCDNCNIIVYDETNVCPLCHSVLYELDTAEQAAYVDMVGHGSPYPDIVKRNKIMHFVMRLILFLFIIAQIGLIVINYHVSPGFWWSGISGIAMLYTYISMIYWIHHDAGYAAKIGLQICLTILLLIGIDYFTGMTGWSLQWAAPGVILCGDAIVFFLMMLNRDQWYSYSLLLLMIAIFSGTLIGLYFAGLISRIILPGISGAVTFVYLLGTVIFGDRAFAREMKRRFHV